MLKKDFKTILMGKHHDEYTKIELINGDVCLDTYICNFKFFMNELRRMENGVTHMPIYTVDEDKMTFWMSAKQFFNSGIVRFTFGKKGSLVFTQVSRKLIIRIEEGEGK